MYWASRSDMRLGLGLGDVALAHGALPDLLGIDARAVVADLDDDAVALLACAQVHRAVRGLAERQARLGVLDAVVDRVAHDVDERVVDLLEHLLVEFGVAALDDQLDVLAELLGEVAHGTRERLEDGVGRQHAQPHALLLQVVDDDRGARHVLRVVLHVLGELAAAVRHQRVDHVDVVADRVHELFAGERLERRLDARPRLPGLVDLGLCEPDVGDALLGLDLRDHDLADEVEQVVDLARANADGRLHLGLEPAFALRALRLARRIRLELVDSSLSLVRRRRRGHRRARQRRVPARQLGAGSGARGAASAAFLPRFLGFGFSAAPARAPALSCGGLGAG